jgi:hypothetical protein
MPLRHPDGSVAVNNAALPAAVSLSTRTTSNKGATLIDAACARISVNDLSATWLVSPIRLPQLQRPSQRLPSQSSANQKTIRVLNSR